MKVMALYRDIKSIFLSEALPKTQSDLRFVLHELLFSARALRLRSFNTDDREGVMAVDLSEMRKLFQAGALKEAIVAPAPMQRAAWVLTVVRTDGSLEYITIARTDRHKVYKSLDAAHSDAQKVGFMEVRTQVA